ncbi:MAG: hypothetical protein JRF60_18895 [Deltaproteobacteria bacterium]|nr:hypothetical protein [Deltaproteobacteria bacterium]
MDYEIKDVDMEDEFKVCPSCGYEDGFHSMFRKEGVITRWLFICPTYHREPTNSNLVSLTQNAEKVPKKHATYFV